MTMSKIGKTLEYLGVKDFKKDLYQILDKDTDNLVITDETSDEMFEKFEQIAFSNYSQNQNLQLYAHSNYRNKIEESQTLHENSVEFFDSNYSSTSNRNPIKLKHR